MESLRRISRKLHLDKYFGKIFNSQPAGRQRQYQAEPPGDLSGFPVVLWLENQPFFRMAGTGRGKTPRSPWWFCTKGECRFDLEGDFGTLYAGRDELAALLEYIGPKLTGNVVTAEFLQLRYMWKLAYDEEFDLATLCHVQAASFGVTNELSTMSQYAIPGKWAKALHEVHIDGIAYRSRFDTRASCNALALFDVAGAHDDWPAASPTRGDDQRIISALAVAGIQVLPALPRSFGFNLL